MSLRSRCRLTPWQGLSKALPIILVYLALDFLILAVLPDRAWQLRPHNLIVIGILGMWRYLWMVLHIVRALYYQLVAFPKIRRRADALPRGEAYPERLYFLIPTYKEVAWISQHMLHSVLRETADLPCPTTLIIVCAGGAEYDLFQQVIDRHPSGEDVEVVLVKQSKGKRVGMADGLRELDRRSQEEDSLVVFMDGDTVLGPGALQKCLPIFKLFPRLGAVTSDELALVEGARWYRKWYDLRFSQRHRMMKSHSLSRRVMTLTGRFSIFRTELMVREEPLRYLENDTLEHWLYGRFRFLTGDDKSTWFHLLRDGWEMLYIPDALVFSMEGSSDQPLRQSMAKMHRWFGNMLRNNGRAIRLGPKPMGFFPWWCLVDQRLSMWTSLVGPVGAILLSIFSSPYYLPFYLFGAILARLLYLTLLAVEGHRMSFLHLPQLFYSQWVAALVKIWVLFRLDRQSWGAARGGMTLEARTGAPAWMRRFVPAYQTVVSGAVFLTLVALGVGVMKIPSGPPALMAEELETESRFIPGTAIPARVLDAEDFGAVANDGIDDSEAIQRALDALPGEGIGAVSLPAGRLLLDGPVVIQRSRTWLVGAGPEVTILESRFKVDRGGAAILVTGKGRQRASAAMLRRSAAVGDRLIELQGGTPPVVGEHLWIGAPNTRGFLKDLGSRRWVREFPWLRQAIYRVEAVDGGMILLDRPLRVEFPAGSTVEIAGMVQSVEIRGLSIRQLVPDASPQSVAFSYENDYPDYAVDGLAFAWAAYSSAEDVHIEMAGRHPINVESSLGVRLRGLEVDGSWNKGRGGSGYLRFSRSHLCRLENSTVRRVRHLVFQWSSAENRVENCRLEVDVNFHGGFSHHNRVLSTRIELPEQHPWPAVYETPPDASWAPPDGSGNFVEVGVTGDDDGAVRRSPSGSSERTLPPGSEPRRTERPAQTAADSDPGVA